AGDGIYTCLLDLKEPVAGLLGFYVVADYSDPMGRVQSHPLFVNVIGGASRKEKKEMLKSQQEAHKLLVQWSKEKGTERAKRDVMVWLTEQPTVTGVSSAPGQDIVIQYRTGITVKVPVEPTAPVLK